MSTTRPADASRRRLGRPSPLGLLAVLLPLLTVVATLLADTRVDAGDGPQAPGTAALGSATLVCPGGEGGAVLAGSDSGASGRLALTTSPEAGRRGTTARLAVRPDRVPSVSAADGDARVLRGAGELAPGLLATRVGGPRLAAAPCTAPAADHWFTGLGAGAAHRSVLELTNPDAGPAVASVIVYGPRGPIDVPRLQGVAVPGRGTLRIDLATTVPRRTEIAVHVRADRGRVAAAVLDTVDPLGSPPPVTEYLTAQDEPAQVLRLLGLPQDASTRVLSLVNPGTDAVRVTLQVVTADSVFTPAKAREVVLDPQSSTDVPLDDVLGAASAGDAFGLQVRATGPVAASLRSGVARDVVRTVAAPLLTAESRLALPPGRAQVDLAGATGEGTVTVAGYSAGGGAVFSKEVEISPDRGVSVDLPAAVRLVSVTADRTAVSAAVRVTVPGRGRGSGVAVLPVLPLVRESLVPQVGVGLP